jgi:hypothetical protein
MGLLQVADLQFVDEAVRLALGREDLTAFNLFMNNGYAPLIQVNVVASNVPLRVANVR